MGCQCELHVHQNENEANMDQLDGSHVSRPIEINSELSNKMSSRDKEAKLKSNLKKNLPKIGTNIPLKEFNKIITPNINNYMSQNKLNAPNYSQSNISTFQSEPIQFKNNNIYYGNWNENNQMEGHGIYYIQDRKIITEGIWNKGNIVYGRIFFPEEDIYEMYEGEMKNSLPDGKGKITFRNGDKYIGNFKHGEMNGNGNFIFADKTEYKGDLENGLFNGKGQMIWDNGTIYEGYFSDSTLTGEGTIYNGQNEKYQGNFDKNEFNGMGTYFYQNEDKYEGNFEYGIKRGNGKYFRSNDNIVFDGIWNGDLPNGNGIIKYRGNSLKGFWRNGVFIGNSENKEENEEIFNNIEKDIKPYKITIIPNSLPHLANLDSTTSQFIPGDFI
jgi:hypothetical protein